MNDLASKAFTLSEPVRQVEPPLTSDELRQLRDILSVASVDPASGALTLRTGEARVTLRPNGELRLEGRAVSQVAQGRLVLNGAAIELN